VALSEQGQALLAGIQQQRTEWFRELMDDWTAEEASDFAGHLERLGGALERSRDRLLDRRTGAVSTPTLPTEN
jgi:DNA-binding MarR family transcriptional regulator